MRKKDRYLVELGAQIRSIRENKGFSQEGLALEAKIDRSYYGAIERGERNVSFLTLIRIAKSLKCNITNFVKEIPNGK